MLKTINYWILKGYDYNLFVQEALKTSSAQIHESFSTMKENIFIEFFLYIASKLHFPRTSLSVLRWYQLLLPLSFLSFLSTRRQSSFALFPRSFLISIIYSSELTLFLSLLSNSELYIYIFLFSVYWPL